MKKAIMWVIIFVATLTTVYAQQLSTNGGQQLDNGGVMFIGNAIYFQPENVTVPDLLPPIILTLDETISNESINITWTTDENANYTLQLSTGLELTNASFSLVFFQNITGLLNFTTYSYNITACDQSGNCNTTVNINFTTLQNVGPVLPIICTDTVNPLTDCTMVSPVLSTCTNYTIYNLTGTLIQNETELTEGFVPNTYYFIFNETAGQYVVTFCDGTTKEVLVTQTTAEDNNMAYSGIGILFVGMMFFSVYVASAISSKDEQGNIIQINKILKFILYGTGLLALYFGANLAYGIALEESFTGNITSSLSTFNWYVLIIAVVILILITWATFYNEFVKIWDWVLKTLGVNPNRRRRNK